MQTETAQNRKCESCGNNRGGLLIKDAQGRDTRICSRCVIFLADARCDKPECENCDKPGFAAIYAGCECGRPHVLCSEDLAKAHLHFRQRGVTLKYSLVQGFDKTSNGLTPLAVGSPANAIRPPDTRGPLGFPEDFRRAVEAFNATARGVDVQKTRDALAAEMRRSGLPAIPSDTERMERLTKAIERGAEALERIAASTFTTSGRLDKLNSQVERMLISAEALRSGVTAALSPLRGLCEAAGQIATRVTAPNKRQPKRRG